MRFRSQAEKQQYKKKHINYSSSNSEPATATHWYDPYPFEVEARLNNA
jgi:hypothetical protein